MFCKNCGKESDNIKKFCTNCGVAFSSHVDYQDKTKHQPTSASVASIVKKVNTSRIIQILVVVAIIGAVIYGNLDENAITTNNNALTNYDSGNSEQAITQFQQASKDAVSNDTKISTLKNLAYVYSSESKEDLAISTFKEALALTSVNSFDYYLISGEIALLEGKPNAAQLAYNKAYQINSNDFQINSALALFYLDLGSVAPQYVDYKKALQYAQRTVQLSDLQIAKQNLGLAYYFNENYDQAIKVFASLSPDKDPYISYWLGLSYIRNDDPVNAKVYLRKAIAGGVKVPQEIYDYLNSN